MSQLTSIDRKEKNMSIIPSKFKIRLKSIIHPLLLSVARKSVSYKIEKCNKYASKDIVFDKKRPIIYACNHSTSFDVPIAFTAIKKHTLLFAGKQPLEKIDELFFNLNGTIYVDRKNKEDMALSKEAIIGTLKNNNNILIFPEGTWNMTDSNLMLEMKWGIIDIAKQSNAIIVPLALDYDYDNKICRYKFGDSIDANNYSLKEGIRVLRNALASLKWDLFEEKGLSKRKELDLIEEQKKIMHSVEEYPKLDYEYEKSIVFHSYARPEEVFEPIKKLYKK